ncbi:aminopeptidase [Sulfolobales archaeon HS-7]|nr:aminopeptidase [Sulfolobales archaeon HS-7]
MNFIPKNEDPVVRLGRNYVLKEHELNYPEIPDFKVRHESFELYVKPEQEEIEGVAAIDVESNGKITLDANHFEISAVQVDGNPAEWKYDGRKLIVKVSGKRKVTIRYRVKASQGLRFLKRGEFYEVGSTGEVNNAPNWLPVVNSPGVKCTTEKVVRVPKPYVAVSNGSLVKQWEDNESNYFHWVMDKPHSAYLNSLAVGVFDRYHDEWEGISLEFYLPKGFGEFHKNLSATKDAVSFFSEYTGVKYPYKKYAQVVLFGMRGGMEYITSTHLTWTTMHDEIAEMDFSSDSLVSHELAHQWFGDLVTTKDWSNIWLNEAFASYFQALYFLHSKGEDEFVYDLYRKLQDYLVEYAKYSRPIVTRYYKFGEELFDRHTYPKGALVVHTLRNVLGDELFRKGIKHYLSKHSFSSVDTEDFRKAMEEASEKDLTWFFDKYVYSANHPIFNLNFDGEKVVIEQVQDGPEYNHTIELKVVNRGEKSIKKIELKRVTEVNVEGDYVCLDPKFSHIAVVNDLQEEERLLEEVRDEDIKCVINAINGLTKFRDGKAISALNSLLLTSFWGVKYEAALALGKIGTKEALKALMIRVEPSKAMRGVVKALGEFKFSREAAEFLVSVLEQERSYYVKAEAITSLGKIGLPEFREKIASHFGERSHVDVISTSVIEALAYLGDEESFNFVVEKGVKSNNELIRAASARHLGKFGKKAMHYLKSLVKDESAAVRGSAVSSLGEMGDKSVVPILKEVVDNEDEDGRLRVSALRYLSTLTQT